MKEIIKNVFEINVNGKKTYGSLITEIGIDRLLSHGKDGMIIISACRDKIFSKNDNCNLLSEYEEFIKNTGVEDNEETQQMWLEDRNRREDARLKEFLRTKTNYSYTQAYGGYHDAKEEGVPDSFEPSYIIYNRDRQGRPLNFEDLRNLAMELCKEYHQDSVYLQAPGEAPIYINEKGEKVNSSSSLNFIKDDPKQMYFTTNKRKKERPHTLWGNTTAKRTVKPHRFTADISFESIMLPVGPGSIIELKQRIDKGEYLLENFRR